MRVYQLCCTSLVHWLKMLLRPYFLQATYVYIIHVQYMCIHVLYMCVLEPAVYCLLHYSTYMQLHENWKLVVQTVNAF